MTVETVVVDVVGDSRVFQVSPTMQNVAAKASTHDSLHGLP